MKRKIRTCSGFPIIGFTGVRKKGNFECVRNESEIEGVVFCTFLHRRRRVPNLVPFEFRSPPLETFIARLPKPPTVK